MPRLMGLRLEWSVAEMVRMGAPRLSLPPGEGGREGAREGGREGGREGRREKKVKYARKKSVAKQPSTV